MTEPSCPPATSAIRTCRGLLPATILAFLFWRDDSFASGPVMMLFSSNLPALGQRAALSVGLLLFRRGRLRRTLISIGG
ncbi:MAG: hypothetical protein KGL20_03655 [Rhodospirillales bacterium]|nr:hypothetical protein [Rhodospirillales bacterium]